VAAFVFGFAVKKAPPAAGVAALLLSAPFYGALQWAWGDVPYLHRMLVTFVALIAAMAAITLVRPLPRPRVLPVRSDVDLAPSWPALAAGLVVIAAALSFFAVFW